MSRHFFNTVSAAHGPVTVLLGWDRPLRYFFCVVEADNEACADEYLYSNLNEPDAFRKNLDDYRQKLAALQITVPESLFREVLKDSLANTGDRDVIHAADGSFEEQA